MSITIPNSVRYSPPKTVRKLVRLHRKPVIDKDGGLLLPAETWASINKFGLQTQLKPDFSNLFDLLAKARRREAKQKGVKSRALRRMHRADMAKQSRRQNRTR